MYSPAFLQLAANETGVFNTPGGFAALSQLQRKTPPTEVLVTDERQVCQIVVSEDGTLNSGRRNSRRIRIQLAEESGPNTPDRNTTGGCGNTRDSDSADNRCRSYSQRRRKNR